MNDILKQIESLAKQIEQLTAQVTVPVVEERTNIDAILAEAAENPFEYHEVGSFDEHVKVQYMKMLLGIFEYTSTKLDERYQLAAKIYYALNIQTDFLSLLQKSKTLSVQDVRNFVTIVQETEITEHFVIDLLMIAGVEQQSITMQYVAKVVAAMAVSEKNFKSYCQLTTAILTVDHDTIYELLIQNEKLRAAAGHYLMIIHSNFAPMIRIEGDGEQVVKMITLHTKRLHLKNVRIELLSKYTFDGYKELVLENCVLSSSHLILRFSNIEKLILHNIDIKQTKKISTIQVTNCREVLLKKLLFQNIEVQGKYLCRFNKVSALRIEDSKFKEITLLSNDIQILTLVKLKDIGTFKEQNVQVTKCKISSGALSTPIKKLV